ncbi:MAG: TolC family protein [Spirochaetales bacterium]
MGAVLLLGVYAPPLSAQNNDPLQLDADLAVEMALQRNLGIRTQELEVMIEERNYADRWNVFLPQISARGTLSRANEEQEGQADVEDLIEAAPDPTEAPLEPEEPPEPEDPPRWNLSTNLDISLTLTRQMIDGLRARASALETAEISLREARRETEREVRLSFYELLLQQEQIRLAERRLAEAEQRYEEAQEDYEDGVIDEFTLLSTQVNLENQRPALRRQRQGYDAAMRQFALSIGVPPEEELELEGEIGVDPVDLLEENRLRSLIGGNADVREARRGIEQTELSLDSTVSGMYPTLTLAYNVDPGLTGDPFSSDLFESDNWGQRSGAFSIALNVPIDPLLPRSSTRTDIAEQERQIEQGEIAVQQAIDGAQSSLVSLVDTLEITLDSMESVGLNVELAERALELAEEGYDSGFRDISDVRDAEIDLIDARLDLLEEQFNYREALVELQFLLDTPLSEFTETEE